MTEKNERCLKKYGKRLTFLTVRKKSEKKLLNRGQKLWSVGNRKYIFWPCAIKDAELEADKNLNDLFLNMSEKQDTKFWKTWRRTFSSKSVKPANVLNGKMGEAEMLSEFTDYFSDVYKPNTSRVPGSTRCRICFAARRFIH
jgi:hypothetical protein